MPPPPRTGTRGGSTEDLPLAQTLFEANREHEYEDLRERILQLAQLHGEFHCSMISEREVSEPNMIGAAVNALARSGKLERLNKEGQAEHRAGGEAAHGRRSYVWRLKGSADRPWTPEQRGRFARFSVEELLALRLVPQTKMDNDPARDLHEEIGEELERRSIWEGELDGDEANGSG